LNPSVNFLTFFYFQIESKNILMKRRNFFKTTALGGSVIAISGLGACVSKPDEKSESKNKITPSEFELNEITIDELQAKMQSGELTAVQICQKYLDRIKRVDPLLKAVIELNPEALDIAAMMDAERKDRRVRGPLHGIPIMIKDNIDAGDKMQTTAGSLALEGNIAPEDAFIIKKLREAGAVLLGKTNLSEWANFRSESSSSGWSGRGGQVRNPYCLDRSPCGSSSGSGAAVSANLCAVTIGTETDGSIVCPSGINGIVGIKPTLGMLSRRGIIPIAHSQDTAGPMARSVKDAAILLGALAEFDPNDGETHVEKGEIFKDYTQFLDKDGLKGARIGLATNMMGFHKNVDELIKQVTKTLLEMGAEVIEFEFGTNRKMGQPEYQVLLYEFKTDLNKYLESHPNAKPKSMAELIEFNKTNADKEMLWFGQEIFEEAQKKGDLTEKGYLDALAESKKLSQKEGIDAEMKKHNFDVIIAPTNGPAWTIDWVNGDHYGGGSSSPAAIAGYPSVTVPAGFVHGLPVGVSFFGKAWSEPKLLKYAFAFEQATKHRKTPEFIESKR
jgi:amidase